MRLLLLFILLLTACTSPSPTPAPTVTPFALVTDLPAIPTASTLPEASATVPAVRPALGGGLRWQLPDADGNAVEAPQDEQLAPDRWAASSSAGYRRVSSSMAIRPSSRASEAPRQ